MVQLAQPFDRDTWSSVVVDYSYSAVCKDNYLHNITLSQRTTMTMPSNDTLVDTPFQLISDFSHVNQGVLCSEHAEQASSRGVLEGGGGGGGQQAC